jgi:hypothetical protein
VHGDKQMCTVPDGPPAVDRAFGGSRPSGEPVVARLDVIDASGARLPGALH